MTSLGAFFDSSSLLKLKENEPSGIGRIAVADAGFQLFISGPTSTTVCNKMSAFIQRDFLASKKPFEIFCNFSRQIEIEYSQKAQNRLYFHEFLALF